MLFPYYTFRGFTQNEVAETFKSTKILMNIDAQNRGEVDEMASLVRKVGGTVYAGPETVQGWMYAVGFEDLD
jgi:uncharacterized protein